MARRKAETIEEVPEQETVEVPQPGVEETEETVQIKVDEPITVKAEGIFGTDFKTQESVMDYAYAIHCGNQDNNLNFIAEVREICFRSKLEYSPDELTAYLRNIKGAQ